jgi:ABC-type phosphate transport system substrate-binding protein
MAKPYGKNAAVDFAASNLITFNGSFTRGAGQPIDKSSVWYPQEGSSGYERAVAYAATDAAYVGQVIAVIDDTVSLYIVINEAGTLQPLTLRDIFAETEHGKILTWDSERQVIVPKDIVYYEQADGSGTGLLSFFE